MAKDNGGAIAQKGFNYQNHVISLGAIRNYKKRNFTIYVESDDDFEVTYDDDYHAYIQTKGQKLSICQLLRQTNNKPSIFEKNLSSGDSKSKYKIVVIGFTEADLKSMQEQIDDEELFYNSWLLNEEQKQQVKEKINNDIGDRINNFALVKTDFENRFESARTFLKGELVNQNISVDGRDDTILNELMSIIQQKSEKIINTEQDKLLKTIKSEELEVILKKVTAIARFKDELESFKFPTYKKELIINEAKKIILDYSAIKKIIIRELTRDKSSLESKPLVNLIDNILRLEVLNDLSENTKYAIIISAYCDIIEGITNE